MGENGRRTAKKIRNFAVTGLAGCLLVYGGMQVNAATLKDVFDENYYADTYGDLKETYGYDRKLSGITSLHMV